MSSIELRIQTRPENINQLENYVQEVVTQVGMGSNKFADILISLTEAVNNAMIHGNKNCEEKNVLIRCKGQKAGIAFLVKDEGDGFNPSEVPNPTDENLLDCCGGRGVYIMTQLADRVKYMDNGTTVEMYFKK
ncbi:MAG TPA: ATP-binding protein [Saprospiraceae bacterium]|nr:ATP-binding protein [Saprospiraceae bacterium]HOY12535.1 ATP-binding protein [Saprospiraceae bacterium]HPN68803.1 ATP-binding protein [Saprospiraceae bacterium]